MTRGLTLNSFTVKLKKASNVIVSALFLSELCEWVSHLQNDGTATIISNQFVPSHWLTQELTYNLKQGRLFPNQLRNIDTCIKACGHSYYKAQLYSDYIQKYQHLTHNVAKPLGIKTKLNYQRLSSFLAFQ